MKSISFTHIKMIVKNKQFKLKQSNKSYIYTNSDVNMNDDSHNVDDLSHQSQLQSLREMYLDFSKYKSPSQEYFMCREIKKKLESYKQQDKKKSRETNNVIDLSNTIELLLQQKLRCHYCLTKILVLYPYQRQSNQWTLDRIDNESNHNESNVCVSCLRCNLAKRSRNHDAWEFTKQLKIVKM